MLGSLEKENVDPADLETIITFIETSVGRGHFAVAADMSDHMRVHCRSQLIAQPRICLRLDIEHLKRVSYMGYIYPVRRAAQVVLDALIALRRHKHISPEEKAHYEFVATGYVAWLENRPSELSKLITSCEAAEKLYKGPLKHVVQAFLLGMKGRDASISGKLKETKENFNSALASLTDENDFRSKAHLYVIYAEILMTLGDYEESQCVLNVFLKRCTERSFSSHLLLRAVTQLLRMNADGSIHLPANEKRWLLFQAWALVNSFGLSQHFGICPLLMDTTLLLEQLSDRWLTAEAYRQRVLRLVHGFQGHGEQMEAFLRDWLTARGFDAKKLEAGTPLFDCVGTMDIRGYTVKVALQSKAWSLMVRQNDIPGINVWQDAIGTLKNEGCFPPHRLIWYCASGIDVHAKKTLGTLCKYVFGEQCEVDVLDAEAFVDLLLDEPDTLVKLLARQGRVDSLIA